MIKGRDGVNYKNNRRGRRQITTEEILRVEEFVDNAQKNGEIKLVEEN